MKKTVKKLVLAKETVKNLSTQSLVEAAGGSYWTSYSCVAKLCACGNTDSCA